MNKLKKDFIVVYLLRNALATLLITLISFGYSLIDYYHISLISALRRIFADNFYTTIYFLLLWILNYLLFEIYKTIIDIIKKTIGKQVKVPFGSVIPLAVLVVIILIDFNLLFKVNFVLLLVFMFARSIKEIIKERIKK